MTEGLPNLGITLGGVLIDEHPVVVVGSLPGDGASRSAGGARSPGDRLSSALEALSIIFTMSSDSVD
jgi:hypothetical protein